MNWLSSLEFPWLLIIHNLDDPDIDVEEHFPEGQSGTILLTTRDPQKKVHGTVGPRFYLFQELDVESSVELLLKASRLSGPWDSSTRRSAAQIARALGYLPLALVHAGSAISHNLCEFENYLNYYEYSWSRISQLRRSAASASHHLYDFDEVNVYCSFEIIYMGLKNRTGQDASDALDLVRIFSFLHYENIRFDMLLAAMRNPQLERKAAETSNARVILRPNTWTGPFKNLGVGLLVATVGGSPHPVLPSIFRETELPHEDRLRTALVLLVRLSFLSYNASSDSYSMHPLVHTWLRERPQMATAEQAVWCEAANTILAQSVLLPPLGLTEEDEMLLRDLLPHVGHTRKCHERIQDKFDKNIRANSRPFLRLITRKVTQQQAMMWAKFSFIYAHCGWYNEAEQLQLAFKGFVSESLSENHPLTLLSMLLLSRTYLQQSRINDIAELQAKVLGGTQKTYGADHPWTLKAMSSLATAHLSQGRLDEGIGLHRKAIERMTRVLGDEHEDTLIAVDALGQAMQVCCRVDEAKHLHLRAVNGLKKRLGPRHLSTLLAMENLAMAYLGLDIELNVANDIMVEVLAQRKEKLGNENPHTLLAILNLARIKSSLNNLQEAEEMILTVQPIAIQNLGENHSSVLIGQTHLSQVLVRQKRYSEAETILADVLYRRKYVVQVANKHPDWCQVLYYFVHCYQLQGQISSALYVCEELDGAVRELKVCGMSAWHAFEQKARDIRRELEAARRAGS
jgi:hypothetical protein